MINDRRTFMIQKCVIEEILSYADCGTTEPILCRLSDGKEAYIKYPRNPFGPRVLANEWIGNSIADIIGINIPFYGIGILNENVIEYSSIDDFHENNCGECFCSVKIPNLVPITKGLLNSKTNVSLARIILFHFIINECDSHNGNLQYDLLHDLVISLDSSHIFDKNIHMTSSELKEKYLNHEHFFDSYNANEDMYDILKSGGFCLTSQDLLDESNYIKSCLTSDVIHDIIFSIPTSWCKKVGNDIIKTYEEILLYRVSNIIEHANRIIIEGRL